MTRVLIVEPDTVELHVSLQVGCRPATARQVTLTVTRAGAMWCEPMPECDDACRPHSPLPVVRDVPMSKVYHATRIASGWAAFTIDRDLAEAPGGWYHVRIAVDGCDAAELSLLVRCGKVATRAGLQDQDAGLT
jgi:hypothetical protein